LRTLPKNPDCYRIATGLLPNVFTTPAYRSLQSRVNERGSIGLHSSGDMAVEIECDPDARMSKAFAGDFRMHAAGEKVCRVSMAKIMKPDGPQLSAAHKLLPFVRQAAGLHRLAIFPRDDQRLGIEPNAEAQ
jgi:hypothetical protein